MKTCMCVNKIRAAAAMATVCTARAALRALAPPSQRALALIMLLLLYCSRLLHCRQRVVQA